MQWQLFPQFSDVVLAVIAGIVFGFLLRKATLSRFDTMVGQLLIKDFTLLKVVLTLSLTAALLIFFQDLIATRPQLLVSSTPLWMSLVGGGLFGVGLAITGYGPETAPAAIGEGKKEGITAILGFVLGTNLYAYFYPYLSLPRTTCSGMIDTKTMAIILPELFMIGFLAVAFFLVLFITKKNKK